jgi:hypothetical protein
LIEYGDGKSMSNPVVNASKLIGTYRLRSFELSLDGGEFQSVYGDAPRGFLIITPQRMMAVLSAERRSAGKTQEAKAALWDTMIAYSGAYTLDATTLTTRVDTGWDEAWIGTDQVRFWTLDGATLTLRTVPTLDPRGSGKTAIGSLVWTKIE